MRTNWFLALDYWGLKPFILRLKNEFQFALASWHEMAYVLELHWDTILKVNRQ